MKYAQKTSPGVAAFSTPSCWDTPNNNYLIEVLWFWESIWPDRPSSVRWSPWRTYHLSVVLRYIGTLHQLFPVHASRLVMDELPY